MSSRFDLLTQELFQKNINDCSVEELKTLTEQYPYFAPAQYALLKKLRQTNREDYQQQLQKAALYYHNPAGFSQFISEEDSAMETFETNAVSVPDVVLPEATEEMDEVSLPHQQTAEEVTEETTIQEEPIIFNETETPVFLKEGLPTIEELKAPSEVQTNGTAEASLALAFEPYHTVDYFASQGIKLSQEEVTKDRFGRQLKSFTEWLKTMKKLPSAEQAKPIDAVAEEKVENLAAHSVEESDIVTETMAEVWVKQGKAEKAIEVYNKLSLLNPSKSAYFAAKVEFLKKEI